MNDQWIEGTEVEYDGMRGRIAFVDSLYITIAFMPIHGKSYCISMGPIKSQNCL